MVVLRNFGDTCAHVRAKPVDISGHLPPVAPDPGEPRSGLSFSPPVTSELLVCISIPLPNQRKLPRQWDIYKLMHVRLR